MKKMADKGYWIYQQNSWDAKYFQNDSDII